MILKNLLINEILNVDNMVLTALRRFLIKEFMFQDDKEIQSLQFTNLEFETFLVLLSGVQFSLFIRKIGYQCKL